MDTRSEIREFLTSRRARITPDQVGLTAYGPRRVPGLRREEVAVLAGVSGASHLRAILATLDSRQQAMILGHAVPMPMALPFQVCAAGSPGLGTVWKRQASSPVLAL